MSENDSLEYEMIFSEPLDCREPLRIDCESDPENPGAEFLSKVEDEMSLAKNGGSALDPSWSEEIGTAPPVELSKAYLDRSDARLERLNKQLRTFFAGNPEKLEVALDLAEKLRADTREEFAA